jgi:hypothetical protein
MMVQNEKEMIERACAEAQIRKKITSGVCICICTAIFHERIQRRREYKGT